MSHDPLISPVPPNTDWCDGNSTLGICSQEGGAPSPPRSQSRAMVSPWEGQPQRLATPCLCRGALLQSDETVEQFMLQGLVGNSK